MTQIGLDTNVLLRMVLNDDPEQRTKAVALGKTLTEESPGYVSLIVLVEFNWALLSRYRQPKDIVLLTIRRLLRTRTLAFENHDAIVRALEAADRPGVDFTDALIAEHNIGQGCPHTVTFDRNAANRVAGMIVLS